MDKPKDPMQEAVNAVSDMIGKFAGPTRLQQTAEFLTIVAVASKVGKKGFLDACNMAALALEKAQRQGKAKKAGEN